jgi:hypothetical protein
MCWFSRRGVIIAARADRRPIRNVLRCEVLATNPMTLGALMAVTRRDVIPAHWPARAVRMPRPHAYSCIGMGEVFMTLRDWLFFGAGFITGPIFVTLLAGLLGGRLDPK